MKLNKTNPVKTVLVISTGFLVIFLITKMNWALIVSLIVGLIGIFSTYVSKKIDFLWMKLTWMLSLIIPNILLSLLFFLFLFPLALFAKLFGEKDPLNLKNNKDSIYRASDKAFEKASFENTW